MIYSWNNAFKACVTTGAVTTIAAGTATAGHIGVFRWAPTPTALYARLRSLEVEFILTTAFGAAQEVGFEAYIARTYTAAHTNGTAVTLTGNSGKKATVFNASQMTCRVATAAEITAGTHTIDTNAIARGSLWAGAIGAQIATRYYDFTTAEPGGILLANNEGLIIRNTILMGATGVGKWHFTLEWDEGSKDA